MVAKSKYVPNRGDIVWLDFNPADQIRGVDWKKRNVKKIGTVQEYMKKLVLE